MYTGVVRILTLLECNLQLPGSGHVLNVVITKLPTGNPQMVYYFSKRHHAKGSRLSWNCSRWALTFAGSYARAWGEFFSLTHLPLVPHVCINESGQHCLRYWLVAYSASSHYLNQYWVLSIGPLGTNFSEYAIKIHNFSTEMHLKISSVKCRPFCSACVWLGVEAWDIKWVMAWH